MRHNLRIAVLFTLVTTVMFGVLYPLGMTGLAQLLFPAQANGSLIEKDGHAIGSKLIGQTFSSAAYFQSRPSTAGTGYDATQSGGSNLGPTNHRLIDRVKASVDQLHAENPGVVIPVDLVTTSGSGLDPEISPAAAEFQVPRVAEARGMTETAVRALVNKYTMRRQFGFLGERRVRVLELNLELDAIRAVRR